jgi:hypothetical protein
VKRQVKLTLSTNAQLVSTTSTKLLELVSNCRHHHNVTSSSFHSIIEMDTAIPYSLNSKTNRRSCSSIACSVHFGPWQTLFALGLCFFIIVVFLAHSRYCFGMMLSCLHASLIDSPSSTRLLTFLTIASLSQFVKRRLLAFVGVEGAVCVSVFSIVYNACAKISFG